MKENKREKETINQERSVERKEESDHSKRIKWNWYIMYMERIYLHNTSWLFDLDSERLRICIFKPHTPASHLDIVTVGGGGEGAAAAWRGGVSFKLDIQKTLPANSLPIFTYNTQQDC